MITSGSEQTPCWPGPSCGYEIRCASDEDVNRHDDKRERFEPAFGTDTPLVLNHHKTDTAGQGCVQLSIVEPTLHVHVRLVGQRPLSAHADTDSDGYEIDGKCQGHSKERDSTAQFGTTCKLVPKNQSTEDCEQHDPLDQAVFAINFKKHSFLMIND